MTVKQWVVTVAAMLGVLTTSPALASSLCGNRLDLGRRPLLAIIGLTVDQRLVQFRECNPASLSESGSVYGLQAPDTALVGIDFRVALKITHTAGMATGSRCTRYPRCSIRRMMRSTMNCRRRSSK